MQTKIAQAQTKTVPPNPKIPAKEAGLRFPPPTNDQPQQKLFRQGLPAAKSTTLILRRRLTPNEREQLVEDHWQLVNNLLRNYKPTGLPFRAEVGLATAAQIGLITAAESFEDHRPRWQFVVYARTVIVDEIRSELRSYQTASS